MKRTYSHIDLDERRKIGRGRMVGQMTMVTEAHLLGVSPTVLQPPGTSLKCCVHP
ncbi:MULTISPECIES: hypothetical protein [Rhizobium/Agrobacterium group]|uniref:hypothetical protein n=1 Tax=Rhizobium/Agrobacterium group TaxID=227290 RepID=UPI000AF963E7|nr:MULTISPECIES: hypothetical protein [Rhizobium/Agrobacterium group]MUO92137.1 hypothetical protein [Agrobacterium vitis]MUZ55467.1 hypothetical protein [Agrobacterium vitis]MUZ94752.1 hypothetical protein [Agrobacterium vitis]MVA43089.1 hypothetical protein [Agrobacterium vitis]MVA48710.1 hypothetical protein [Agrobacterium vitis]